MYSKDNKIKKSIRLTPEIIEAIENFRGHTRQDFTGAVETLLIKGLENHESLQELTKKIDRRLADLQKQQQNQANRLANLIISLFRFSGKIYGHTKNIAKGNINLDLEEIAVIETNGINAAMQDIKYKEGV